LKKARNTIFSNNKRVKMPLCASEVENPLALKQTWQAKIQSRNHLLARKTNKGVKNQVSLYQKSYFHRTSPS